MLSVTLLNAVNVPVGLLPLPHRRCSPGCSLRPHFPRPVRAQRAAGVLLTHYYNPSPPLHHAAR